MFNSKQVSKRISLKTRDKRVAKFLAIQLKARIEMIDLNNVRVFEISYDENNNIKNVKVTDENDSKNLQEFLKLKETHVVEQHKRDIEKLKLEQELKTKNDFVESSSGKNAISLYEKLQNSLTNKDIEIKSSLESLKKTYLENLTVSKAVKYKYDSVISKFVTYCDSQNVKSIDKIDRKFTFSYIQYLRKNDKKNDKTIRNIFNVLSTFYNNLLVTGETKEINCFSGHKFDVEKIKRQAFTKNDLDKIFTQELYNSNKKMFFVCLLLLTTGARPNEICQLWTDDIIKVDDFYTIRITENEKRDQKVKNKSSNRVVYLNKLLIDFKFIEYVKSVKLGLLFELTRPDIKNYSTFISEDFTKILRNLKIETKTMYCFRHTVMTRLKQNLVNLQIIQDLVGHTGESTAEIYYQDKHLIETLKNQTHDILTYKEIKFFNQV
jgi:integrase